MVIQYILSERDQPNSKKCDTAQSLVACEASPH
jgi:hypothetical protein